MPLAHIHNFLLSAENKTLGTYGNGKVNVVPVSTILIQNNTIVLVNYFMNKTISNIEKHPKATLTAWTGFEGYQLKGVAELRDQGALFDAAVSHAKETHPERLVKNIITLAPEEIYSVSPSTDAPGERVF